MGDVTIDINDDELVKMKGDTNNTNVNDTNNANIINVNDTDYNREVIKILEECRRETNEASKSHRSQSNISYFWNNFFGVLGIVLAAITSSSGFVTFQNCKDGDGTKLFDCNLQPWVRLSSAILIILLGIVNGLVAFRKYQTTAEQHSNAANDFDVLAKNIRSIIVKNSTSDGTIRDTIKKDSNTLEIDTNTPLAEVYDVISNQIYKITKSYPPIPFKIKDVFSAYIARF